MCNRKTSKAAVEDCAFVPTGNRGRIKVGARALDSILKRSTMQGNTMDHPLGVIRITNLNRWVICVQAKSRGAVKRSCVAGVLRRRCNTKTPHLRMLSTRPTIGVHPFCGRCLRVLGTSIVKNVRQPNQPCHSLHSLTIRVHTHNDAHSIWFSVHRHTDRKSVV